MVSVNHQTRKSEAGGAQESLGDKRPALTLMEAVSSRGSKPPCLWPCTKTKILENSHKSKIFRRGAHAFVSPVWGNLFKVYFTCSSDGMIEAQCVAE